MFNKKKKVPVTLVDPDTQKEYTAEVMPGTPEFAAGTKKMVDDALSGVKQKIGQENWDEFCTVMFSCSYDKKEGFAQCIDGNTDQLMILMGIVISEMADRAVEREKLLPQKKQMGGNAIAAGLIQQLMGFVSTLEREGKDSGIITP